MMKQWRWRNGVDAITSSFAGGRGFVKTCKKFHFRMMHRSISGFEMLCLYQMRNLRAPVATKLLVRSFLAMVRVLVDALRNVKPLHILSSWHS